MKNLKSVLMLNIIIFSLVLIIHLIRIITGFYAQLGNWVVPIWINYIAVVLVVFLIYVNYNQIK